MRHHDSLTISVPPCTDDGAVAQRGRRRRLCFYPPSVIHPTRLCRPILYNKMVRRSGCTRFQRRASSGVDDEFPAEVRVVARRCSEGVSAFTLITSTRLTDPAYYQSANVIAENLGQTHQCSRRRKAAMRCVFHVRHWKLQTSASGAYDEIGRAHV